MVKKRVVMIIARQHPGESTGSFVVQGKPEEETRWQCCQFSRFDRFSGVQTPNCSGAERKADF